LKSPLFTVVETLVAPFFSQVPLPSPLSSDAIAERFREISLFEVRKVANRTWFASLKKGLKENEDEEKK
jgi:hypothetical protein